MPDRDRCATWRLHASLSRQKSAVLRRKSARFEVEIMRIATPEHSRKNPKPLELMKIHRCATCDASVRYFALEISRFAVEMARFRGQNRRSDRRYGEKRRHHKDLRTAHTLSHDATEVAHGGASPAFRKFARAPGKISEIRGGGRKVVETCRSELTLVVGFAGSRRLAPRGDVGGLPRAPTDLSGRCGARRRDQARRKVAAAAGNSEKSANLPRRGASRTKSGAARQPSPGGE
jgi:hypothetical protein